MQRRTHLIANLQQHKRSIMENIHEDAIDMTFLHLPSRCQHRLSQTKLLLPANVNAGRSTPHPLAPKVEQIKNENAAMSIKQQHHVLRQPPSHAVLLDLFPPRPPRCGSPSARNLRLAKRRETPQKVQCILPATISDTRCANKIIHPLRHVHKRARE